MSAKNWKESLRAIMNRAWSLFRKGVQSLSISLRISWKLHKRQVSEADLAKMLKKLR